MSEITEEKVLQYLKNNPVVLEAYVTSSQISRETFQKWTNRRQPKLPKESSRKSLVGFWGADDLASRRRLIMDQGDQKIRLLFELGECCAQMTATDAVELTITNDEGSFNIYKTSEGLIKLKKAKKIKKPAAHTQTLIDPSEKTIGEVQFFMPITEKDKQIVNVICTWALSCIYYAQASLSSKDDDDETTSEISNNEEEAPRVVRQRKLNTFLLDVTRSIFQDIVSMDTVIIKVMNFAQKLVNADRASLFLVDAKTKELYARIFDVGTGQEEHVRIDREGQKEIRFPITKGIAGYVACTGEGLNITNAYDDQRFNKEVDSKTGYTTRTILCMPIFIRGVVIGVVQMVNKQSGNFTKDDEDAFQVFAVYCGLALHHAKLYDKIRRSEQKYRVALEVLAYHSVCNRDEVAKLKKIQLKERVQELETFDFNGMKLSELEKPLYAVYMFKTLFHGDIRFDQDDLTRFVLTVRKNYRRVAYHNWAHGWSVAHAMFVLLFSNDQIFRPHEALALYVACLCHDLDHRGKNNAYMKTMSTPLAAIYTTSVMEHHHFNQTVTILQQDGHNILKSLSSEEYKQALSLIKHCILATDLALFFSNKAELTKILDDGKYDITDEHHRKLTQAILMTGCDLIASAKPWQIQTETVKVIFEEFYEQGDAERNNGRVPIPMMDRQKAHELPQMQVGFMRGICLPCYELIARIIPEASGLRDRCRYNAEKWEELAEDQRKREEEKAKESAETTAAE